MDARLATLVVIGASARAFAASAARAGWRVYAADLFDDLDLVEVAADTACAREHAAGYPAGLADLVREFPPAPCCYVGALENHPDILRAIARDRHLLGSPPEAIAAVRDPASLRTIVRAAGLGCPDCHREPDGLPIDGSYLRKPLAGAGGRGIVPWDAASPRGSGPPAYWQRRIAGASWSAAYLVAADGGRLIAASRQLTGAAWCHARPFAYAGSIGVPLEAVPGGLRRQFEALAPALVRCGLRGAVGADVVVDASGAAWVVEVNPRPTASLELLERATGLSIAAAHVAACSGPVPAGDPPATAADGLWHAKAVVHAPDRLPIDGSLGERFGAWRRRWSTSAAWPGIADIPRPGTCVPAGGPVCTVFAAAPGEAAVMAALRVRVAEVVAAFSPPSAAEPRPAGSRSRIP